MGYAVLSAQYFFYFSTLAVLVPFWGLYLQDLGYSALQIGALLAIPTVTRLIAPNLWGWLADHTHDANRVARLANWLAIAGFALVFFASGFWTMALAMSAFTFFWNATLPQMEAAALNHLAPHYERYGQVRLWGSLGFVVLVFVLGPAVDAWGTGLVPGVTLGTLAATLLASYLFRTPVVPRPPAVRGAFKEVLNRPGVMAFLGAALLMQFSHAPYYSFFSIYLEGLGYTKTATGLYWIFGTTCEVLLFLVMHRVLRRVEPLPVMTWCMMAAALRWLLTAFFATRPVMLAATQALHAVTFGAFHVSAMQIVHRLFTGRTQFRGQAVYNSMAYGAGIALGSLAAGFAWDSLGPQTVYIAAAVTALGAAVITARFVKPALSHDQGKN
jgi:PPP family 3-phenylpropionic acid transporter